MDKRVVHLSELRNKAPVCVFGVKNTCNLFEWIPSLTFEELFPHAGVRDRRWLLDHINPLKPELNPICYLLALLGAHHFLHVSRIRVKLLTLR